MEKSRKGLFLDLDNTLIRTQSGNEFPKTINDWVVIDKVADQARKLAVKYNLVPIVVTNQGGIEAGFVTSSDFQKKMRQIVNWLIAYHNLTIMWYYYCDRLDKDCFFRKPNPGMAYRAALHHDIILKHSYMVGDASGKKGDHSSDDRDFAHLAGIGTYYDVKDFVKLKI